MVLLEIHFSPVAPSSIWKISRIVFFHQRYWAHRLVGLADPRKSDRGLVQTIRERSIRSVAEIPADSTDYIFRPLCFYKSVNSYKLKSGKLSSTTAREM